MKAWYFSKNPPKLGYGDGRVIRAGRKNPKIAALRVCFEKST